MIKGYAGLLLATLLFFRAGPVQAEKIASDKTDHNAPEASIRKNRGALSFFYPVADSVKYADTLPAELRPGRDTLALQRRYRLNENTIEIKADSLARQRPNRLGDTLAPERRFSGAPLIFAQPETGLAFGAGGIWYHRPRNLVRPGRSLSSMTALVLYTLRGQFIGNIRGQLFTDTDRWRLNYELGYFYFPYRFYGIGNDTREEDEELYTNNFPLSDLTGLRGVFGNFYMGAGVFLEHNRYSDLADSGLLASGSIPGIEGGLNWGLGPRILFDSRDNPISPYRGWYASAGATFHRDALGSAQDYTDWEADIRTYLDLGRRPDRHHILGWQIFGQVVSGDPPFHRLALLGGPDRMRGFFEGRYRDKIYATTQVEYRFPIWRFIRGSAFAGAGDVRPDLQSFVFRELLYSGGAGLRITLSAKDRTQIRFDAAIGRGGSTGYYLQFRESF